jgi:hypothetical protein
MFELRAGAKTEAPISLDELGICVRKASERVSLARSMGECVVTRVPSGFPVAINIAVDLQTPVAEGRRIADRVAGAVRALNQNIRRLFVQWPGRERF